MSRFRIAGLRLAILFLCSVAVSRLSLAEVTVPAAVLQAEQERIEVMKSVAPSVVAIFAADGQGGGSGVLIEPNGIAITNYHVVMGQGPFLKCGLNDGKVYDSVLLGIDPTGDVALIQLLGRDDFPIAPIGDSDAVQMGDSTFAMGNPFLLATDFQPTVTWGMVSGTHRYQYPAGTFLEYTDCIQVDASINPGNSGGPLFNTDGELIGINGRISAEKRGKLNVGAGYAISINQVMNFLDHLKSGRIVDHATLGATVSDTPEGSVLFARVMESSEAYRRGVRRGDELVSFAGRPIRSVNQFKNILGIYPDGWTVPLVIRREGQQHVFHVRLMPLHRQEELAATGDDPGGPEGGPDEDGRPQLPPELHDPHTPQGIPEQYADLYEPRSGFANYAVNLRHQKRLLSSVDRWGNYSSRGDAWAISGQLDGQPVQIRLLPDAAAARIGNEFVEQSLNEDFQDVPAGSGGLLAALVQLKNFLQAPEESFTEFYYVGSEPVAGKEERTEVIVTTRGLATTRWDFSSDDGRLLGFETAIREDMDPCRITFEGTTQVDGGLTFPETLHIEHGDETFGTLTIESVKFSEPASGGASS